MKKTKLLLLVLVIAFNLIPGCKERLFNNPFDPERDERGYEIESTINLENGIIPRDITFAGDSLWIVNGSRFIYSVNYSSGNIIRYLEMYEGNLAGIGYDGSNLWINIDNKAELFKISVISGEIIRTLKISEGDYSTIDFFESAIYIADRKSNSIVSIDPVSGERIQTVTPPVFSIDGFCYDGQYFWILEASTLKIFKTDSSGNIVNTFQTPSENPTAIACSNDFLWISDSGGKIYKLRFR